MISARTSRWSEAVLPWVLGTPRERLALLRTAFDRDRAARRELKSSDTNLPPQAVTTLVSMYLALIGLELAAFSFSLRENPSAALHMLVLVQTLLVIGLGAGTLSQTLLADEGFRVIASWPVRSATYLAARLHRPTMQSVGASALVCLPSALVIGVVGPLPVVTGVVYAAMVPALALSALWLVAVGLIAALAGLGAQRARGLALLLLLLGVLSPIAVAVIGVQPDRLLQTVLATPGWVPTRWFASIPMAASGALPKAELWMLPAALATIALPAYVLRKIAHRYTAGLGTARQSAPSRSLPAVIGLIGRLARRPEDRLLATLCVAHTRTDWRFRAHLLAVPALTAGGVAGLLVGLPLERAFADPFVLDGALHPGMLTLALGLVLPLLGVPGLMRSADSGASWMLRAGTLRAPELRAAMHRMARLLFVLPYLLALAVLYGLAGVSPVAIAAHVGFVGLGAELTLGAVLVAMPHLPFSRANDDEELAAQMMVAVVLLYVLGVIIAAFVFHVVYRWPVMYLATVGFMVFVRQVLIRRGRARGGEKRFGP